MRPTSTPVASAAVAGSVAEEEGIPAAGVAGAGADIHPGEVAAAVVIPLGEVVVDVPVAVAVAVVRPEVARHHMRLQTVRQCGARPVEGPAVGEVILP